MQNYFSWLGSEVIKTVKKPWRIQNIFNKKKLLPWMWSFRPEERTTWQESAKAGFQSRIYGQYDEYKRHQSSKLERFLLNWDNCWLKDYDVSYRNALRERLRPHIKAKGTSVLCLAARLGTEVKAFLDLGCFAVGLDLNPGAQNNYVVSGDFHNIQYADESVDLVFTNSFDHVLYPEKILSEVKRVIKPGGKFIAELSLGLEEGNVPGEYESFFWSNLDQIVHLIEEYSFRAVYQEKINNVRNLFIFEKALDS